MPDVARDPAILKRRRLRQVILAVLAGIVVLAVSVALARMEPAAPSVERATVLEDVVKRGSIIRQVRGLGTLVPEDTRWLPATTDGRVERILLRPGARVEADSVILELSNPQVEQEALNARLALQSALAGARQPARPAAERAPDPAGRHGGARLRGAAGEDGGRSQRAAGQGTAGLRADPAAVAAARPDTLKRRVEIEAKRLAAAERPASRRGSACSRPSSIRRGRYRTCATSRLALAEGAARIRRRAAAGAGRGRPARRARPEPGPRGRSGTPEGGAADRGNAGQGHRSRPARRKSTRATASWRARVSRKDPAADERNRHR